MWQKWEAVGVNATAAEVYFCEHEELLWKSTEWWSLTRVGYKWLEKRGCAVIMSEGESLFEIWEKCKMAWHDLRAMLVRNFHAVHLLTKYRRLITN